LQGNSAQPRYRRTVPSDPHGKHLIARTRGKPSGFQSAKARIFYVSWPNQAVSKARSFINSKHARSPLYSHANSDAHYRFAARKISFYYPRLKTRGNDYVTINFRQLTVPPNGEKKMQELTFDEVDSVSGAKMTIGWDWGGAAAGAIGGAIGGAMGGFAGAGLGALGGGIAGGLKISFS
jgi:hypothetical protein